MADFMGNIGQFLSGPTGTALGKVAQIGTAGAGIVGNILNQRARSQELDYLKKSQAALADPTTIAKDVAAATQPLDRALIQNLTNVVSGNLAEQGLSQAPGIQAAAITQAAAPFEQQNAQRALEIVMQRLGLPISYAQTYLQNLPGNVNLAPLFALLRGTPATAATPGTYPNYGPWMGPANVPPNLSDTGLGTPDLGTDTGIPT